MCHVHHVHQRHLVVKSYTNLIVSRTYYLPFLISLILLLPRADLTLFWKDFTTCPPWRVPNNFCVASTMYKKILWTLIRCFEVNNRRWKREKCFLSSLLRSDVFSWLYTTAGLVVFYYLHLELLFHAVLNH